MRSSFKVTVIAVTSFLIGAVGACTSTSAPQNKPPAIDEKTKARIDELKMEVEIGRSMAGYLLQHYGTYQDPELVEYVNKVGLYVASRSEAPERHYMFEVLNSDSINAFSCPGGYVMVTSGAIKLAESEAELAMILGHEIAHIERQHMFKTLVSRSKDKSKDLAERRAKLPPSVRVRARPQATASSFSSNMARYFAGQGGLGVSVLSAVKSGMDVFTQTGLSRDYEFEADERGLNYALRSGYKPTAFNDYLSRLRERKAKLDVSNLDKTHPQLNEREARLVSELKKIQALDAVGAEGKERFMKQKRKLLQKPAKETKSGV